MLTPSVNIVQSSFPDELQGDISGLSRSVSNLGSSLGAAIAGTILVIELKSGPQHSYALALIVLAVISLAGLVAAAMLPEGPTPSTASRPPDADAPGPGTT
jgi:predicted MFS family arabinose efflux permease